MPVTRICMIVPTLALVGLVIATAGCASTYDNRFLFEPRPAEISLTGETTAGQPPREQVRTLVTITGVRSDDRKIDDPATVEIRMRIENTGQLPVTFDPASLELFSADLIAFPAPKTEPGAPVEVAPGDAVMIDAYFPFPDGTYPTGVDLSGLRLGWSVRVGDEVIPASFTFRRRYRRYYDHPSPYYHPHSYRNWHSCQAVEDGRGEEAERAAG